MFGDERPSCPDLAQLMQDWIKQYHEAVTIESRFIDTNSNLSDSWLRICLIAHPPILIGSSQVVGYFDENWRVQLLDNLGNYTEMLVPEDPLFFPTLEARIEEVIRPSHG